MKDKVYIKIKGLALEEQSVDGSITEEADNVEVISVEGTQAATVRSILSLRKYTMVQVRSRSLL